MNMSVIHPQNFEVFELRDSLVLSDERHQRNGAPFLSRQDQGQIKAMRVDM
ncbi:MAG: hypothetical protein ABJ251_04405 [Paracoccaceae bacterium]